MYINVELLRHFFVAPVDWKIVEEKGAPWTASVAALETLYRRAFGKCPLVLKAWVLVSLRLFGIFTSRWRKIPFYQQEAIN